MKRNLSFAILIIATLFSSCQKSHEMFAEDSCHKITVSTDKTGSAYTITTRCGHSGDKCPGCVTIAGKSYHVPCQGQGNVCLVNIGVSFNPQLDGTYTATTLDASELTSEDFFLMPDRSLNYTDEKGNRIFLNIPAQLVFRDSTTRQFTFTGLFYSNRAAYSNN
ncbi:MAG: hypothetical protein MJZ87_09400 [Bacteroidales bacterium]|nr:hypothetical protein [Bacteroidales bacterium]